MGLWRGTGIGKAVRMRRWEIEREDDYGFDMTVITAVIVLPTSWLIIARRQTPDDGGTRFETGCGRASEQTRLRVFRDWNIRSIDSCGLGRRFGSAGQLRLLNTYVRHIKPTHIALDNSYLQIERYQPIEYITTCCTCYSPRQPCVRPACTSLSPSQPQQRYPYVSVPPASAVR